MAGITAAIGKRLTPPSPRRETVRSQWKGAPVEGLWVKEKNIQGIATGNKNGNWNLGVHTLFDWKYVERVATQVCWPKGRK